MRTIVKVIWAHEQLPFGTAVTASEKKAFLGARAIEEMEDLGCPIVDCFFEVELGPNPKKEKVAKIPFAITRVHGLAAGFAEVKPAVHERNGLESAIDLLISSITNHITANPNDIAVAVMTDEGLSITDPAFNPRVKELIKADRTRACERARELLTTILSDETIRDYILDEAKKLANNNGNGHKAVPADEDPAAETELDIRPAEVEAAA